MADKILGIIPARGGSKGIPGKNLQEVGGRPLIAYPIQEANKSKRLTEWVVSTDSMEIMAYLDSVVGKYIPRPAALSEDRSPVVEAVDHVIQEYRKLGREFDIVVLLQPTSPFWLGSELDEALAYFDNPEVDGVVSVIQSTEAHPARMYRRESTGFLSPLLADGETLRRQDLSPVYFRNGCFYAVRTEAFNRERSLMPLRKKGYLMDPYWFLTIDTPRDLAMARIMAEEWNRIHSI